LYCIKKQALILARCLGVDLPYEKFNTEDILKLIIRKVKNDNEVRPMEITSDDQYLVRKKIDESREIYD